MHAKMNEGLGHVFLINEMGIFCKGYQYLCKIGAFLHICYTGFYTDMENLGNKLLAKINTIAIIAVVRRCYASSRR